MGEEKVNYPDTIPPEFGIPLAAALWVIVLVIYWPGRDTK